MESILWIRNKRGQVVPFRANPVQKIYWARKTRRNLWLKPRQKGISKIIDADQLLDCIRKPTNAVVISHEREATQRLFSAVQFFIDTAKTQPAVSIYSKSEIRFPETGSYYYLGTAGQKAFGRGDTINRAHLSEASFYENLERILAGISEAAEYGIIDIETTPNGRGEFYELWQKAKRGESSFTPIFIPWFIDEEYSVEKMTEEEKQGLSASIQEMFAIPDSQFEIAQEERELISKVKSEWGIKVTIGMLKWRRCKIWDKGELFWQEYPEDDVSCFLQTGRSVFHKITTKREMMVPLDNIQTWKASIEEKEILKRKLLYAGLDGAEGTPHGDAHNFSVISIDAKTQKATVIFEITSNEPYEMFDEKVAFVCKAFNIFLGVEKNGVGLAHVQKLKQLGVRMVEWETTAAVRPMMIAELEEAYRKEDLIETYPEAENEARDMIYTESNRPEARKGRHDDRIFGRAVAWQMRKRPMPGVTFI